VPGKDAGTINSVIAIEAACAREAGYGDLLLILLKIKTIACVGQDRVCVGQAWKDCKHHHAGT